MKTRRFIVSTARSLSLGHALWQPNRLSSSLRSPVLHAFLSRFLRYLTSFLLPEMDSYYFPGLEPVGELGSNTGAVQSFLRPLLNRQSKLETRAGH